MTYEEAEEISLRVKWKTATCGEGEQCWCRKIVPEVPILFKKTETSDEDEFIIVGPAEMPKELAEHFVRLHNNWIDGDGN
jgi:hypothetical protein